MADQRRKSKKLVSNAHAGVLEKRLLKFQAKLKENSLETFIVSSTPNKFYLTEWRSDPESGWLVITTDKAYILTDARYSEHATKQVSGFEVVEYDSSLPKFFESFAKAKGFSRVGFESHDISIFNFRRLKRFCKHLKLTPTAYLVEDLRSTKDEVEIKNIKKAVGITDQALKHILNFVKVGMSEKEVSWELEKFMREKGAEKTAWDPFIVAAGRNSSMAHWGASDQIIGSGDMVLVDYGCVFAGYHSDMTRVFFVGKPTDEQKTIYNLVLESQKLGESLIEEGVSAATIYKKVRSFLNKNLPSGIQTQSVYRHSLGHGVGLEVHESPRLSFRSKKKLNKGNVVTVEPGVYIPGWGGVRLEDVIVVKEGGCEVLTKAPKDIEEVTIR